MGGFRYYCVNNKGGCLIKIEKELPQTLFNLHLRQPHLNGIFREVSKIPSYSQLKYDLEGCFFVSRAGKINV